MLSFLFGALIGISITYKILEHLPSNNDDLIYVVARIIDYYPELHLSSENVPIKLSVYVKGNAGHVQDLKCLFPPNFKIEGWEERHSDISNLEHGGSSTGKDQSQNVNNFDLHKIRIISEVDFSQDRYHNYYYCVKD